MRKDSSAALAEEAREMPRRRSPQKREREEEKWRSGNGKAGSECVSGCSKCGGSRRGREGSGGRKRGEICKSRKRSGTREGNEGKCS